MSVSSVSHVFIFIFVFFFCEAWTPMLEGWYMHQGQERQSWVLYSPHYIHLVALGSRLLCLFRLNNMVEIHAVSKTAESNERPAPLIHAKGSILASLWVRIFTFQQIIEGTNVRTDGCSISCKEYKFCCYYEIK